MTSQQASFSWITPIRWSAYLVCGFVVFIMGLAHAEDTSSWENVFSGTTDVSTAGPVQYMVGYSSIGYDHFRSEIMVNWYDSEDRTQTIYDGIYDNPPAKVWSVRDHICVSMETCTQYEDVCKANEVAYRYDIAAKSFVELQNDDKVCHR